MQKTISLTAKKGGITAKSKDNVICYVGAEVLKCR